MKNKNIEKVLLLIAITILLVGIASAAQTNKTTNKNTPKIKDSTKLTGNTITKTQKDKPVKAIKNTNNITKKEIKTEKSKYTPKTESISENNNYDYDPDSELKLSYKKIKDKNYTFTVTAINSKGNYIDNQPVVFNIDLVEYEKTLTKGHATINKKIYNDCEIFASSPDNKYKDLGDYILSETISITPKNPKITIDAPKKIDITENLEITASIEDDNKPVGNKGTVKTYINNKPISIQKPKKGKITLKLEDKKVGTYNIRFKYTTTYNKVVTKSIKVKVTCKTEKLKLKTPTTSTTDKKIKLKTIITNDTTKLNVGKVNYYFKGKYIGSKKVKNGATILNYKLPQHSGKYTLTARYIKNRKTLKKVSKKIKVKDSEKLTFNPRKIIAPNTKYTFKIKVTSPNTRVNYGKVRLTINGKKITRNVRNNIVKIPYKMPKIEKNIKVIVKYIKNGKTIKEKTSKINIKYTVHVTLNSESFVPRGNKTWFGSMVYADDNSVINSGKVVYYLNNQKICSAKVKKNWGEFKYTVTNKPGDYTLRVIYFNSKNEALSKEAKDSFTIVDKLTDDKDAHLITLYPSREYNGYGNNKIGTDYIKALENLKIYNKGDYVELSSPYNYNKPRTYKLYKAMFYYCNSKYQTRIKIVTAKSIHDYYMLFSNLKEHTFRVDVAYKKMTESEKKAMQKIVNSIRQQ